MQADGSVLVAESDESVEKPGSSSVDTPVRYLDFCPPSLPGGSEAGGDEYDDEAVDDCDDDDDDDEEEEDDDVSGHASWFAASLHLDENSIGNASVSTITTPASHRRRASDPGIGADSVLRQFDAGKLCLLLEETDAVPEDRERLPTPILDRVSCRESLCLPLALSLLRNTS